jgi:AcrR family transcriptional regulator
MVVSEMPITPLPIRREEPSRRERQRLETRARLYEAALAEFRRVGFANAQIETIVERAGVARGTFYFHFPTKEHVLLEFQRQQELSLAERIAALPERPESVKAFLLRVIHTISADLRTVGDPALVRELIAMFVRAPRYVDLNAEPFVVALMDYFSEAAERGEVRTDLSPEEITGVFLTTLFGFVVSAADSLEDRLQEFERAIDVFSKGITP